MVWVTNLLLLIEEKTSVNISKEKIIHLGNLKSFHRDIGFDQIIFIEKEVDKAFPITIFNSDGNEGKCMWKWK